MARRGIRIAVAIAAVCSIVGTDASRVDAQPHALPWLRVPVNAAAWGMGGAGSTVLSPYIGLYNPGGLGVYSLSGQSAIAYSEHDDWTFDRVNENTVVTLSAPSIVFESSPTAPRIGIGLTLHDQTAGIRNVISEGHETDYLDDFDSYVFGLGIDLGIQFGAGFSRENAWNFISGENAVVYDYGVYLRTPVFSAAHNFGWLEHMPKIGSVTPEVILTTAYSANDRGEFSSGSNLPEVDLLGLSAEGTLSYESAEILSVLYAYDHLNIIHGGADRTNSGVRFTVMGGLQVLLGKYSPNEGETGYSTNGLAIHSRGLLQWLSILLEHNGGSGLPHLLTGFDVYYTSANFEEAFDNNVDVTEIGFVLNLDHILKR